MGPRQALHARHLLIDAGVIFHGARTERIQSQIDGVVLSREPREVANGLHFAYFGEVLNFRARVLAAQNLWGVHWGNIQGGQLVTALAGRAALENQRLVLIDVLSNFPDHCANTSASASNFSRRLISVAQTSIAFPS